MRSPSAARTLRILTGMDLFCPSVPPSSARRYRHLSPCVGKACGDGHGADSPELGAEGTLPRRDVEDAVPYGGKDLICPSVPPSSARRYRHLSPCMGKACGDGHGADSPELGVEGTLPRRDVEDAVPYGKNGLLRGGRGTTPPSAALRETAADTSPFRGGRQGCGLSSTAKRKHDSQPQKLSTKY